MIQFLICLIGFGFLMILLFVLPNHLSNRLKWLVGFIAFVITISSLITLQLSSLYLSFLVLFILSMLCAFLLFKNESKIREGELRNEIDVEDVLQNHKMNSAVEQLNQQENKEVSKHNEDKIIIDEANFLTARLNNPNLRNEMNQEPIIEEKIEIDFESILSKERG